MTARLTYTLVVWAAVVAVPAGGWAQQGHKHGPPTATDAAVDFGVLPTAPLGPAPCLQSGAIGGPADPCAYLLHHLTPEETALKNVRLKYAYGGKHGTQHPQSVRDRLVGSVEQFVHRKGWANRRPADDPSSIESLFRADSLKRQPKDLQRAAT